MPSKPFTDAEFEVISGPRLQVEDADAVHSARLREIERELPELHGWRLWGAIIVSTAILTVLVAFGVWAIEFFARPVGDAFANFLAGR